MTDLRCKKCGVEATYADASILAWREGVFVSTETPSQGECDEHEWVETRDD